MILNIDSDELNACVQCGLCLSSCPTYRVTGDETMSPRGRIALMREVQTHDAPLTPEVLHAFESCVQCRGCEPACPSGVPYGRLMEQTRETLAKAKQITPWWQRLAMAQLAHPRVLRAGSTGIAAAQRLRLVPKRLGITATIPVKRSPLRTSGDDVHLFTGCVMDAWQRDIHHAAQRVLEAAGFGVTPTGDAAPCCGALHQHAGLTDDTKRMASTMIRRLQTDMPILVDSAGCGAAMKDYGHLLNTDEARAFSARVFDIHEWLAPRIGQLPKVTPLDLKVAVQDPCHIRHVQKVHEATRVVLRPFVRELIDLDEDICCGAGGAYSIMQPKLASDIRQRKVESIDKVNPDLVASANPGCSMHLAGAGVSTVHPMELIDRALLATQRESAPR